MEPHDELLTRDEVDARLAELRGVPDRTDDERYELLLMEVVRLRMDLLDVQEALKTLVLIVARGGSS